MRIALIGTYETPEATGLRIISAFLKARGHQVRMIFLTARRTARPATPYPPALVEQVLARIRDCDLIGVGLMTGCYYLARDLTAATCGNMGHTLVRYRVLTTRGCPFLCAFCCNSR